MTIFVRVSINIPQVSGAFDYHLPVELEELIQPGSLVVVPFGNQQVQGVVLRIIDLPEVPETKAVSALLDPLPAVNLKQLALSEWMASEYLVPLSQCIDLMLPSGLAQHADTLFSLKNASVSQNPHSPMEQRILDVLQRQGGSLRGRQLDSHLPRLDWRPIAKKLTRQGLIQMQPILPPPSVRPRFIRTAQLSAPPELARQQIQGNTRWHGNVKERRLAAIDFLTGEALPVNVAWVYASARANLADLQRLADSGLIQLGESEIWRDPLDSYEKSPQSPPVLTADQMRACSPLLDAIQDPTLGTSHKPFLLQGVTGSGKTEIYLQVVARVIEMGKQAIVLVPEIALTPQTAQRFLARFPGRVGLVHHRLSEGERYDTWRRARSGLLDVIIGPRSALFSPLPSLGLIVVDECHESTYFQDDFPPAYHAIDTAIALARISTALIVLGSATPGVELQYLAQREKWSFLSLPHRLLAHRQSITERLEKLVHTMPSLPLEGEAAELPLPEVKIVDMRAELKEGNRSIISRELNECLKQVLERKEQALIFLNRRGSATYIFCRACGYVLKCPRCDLPLTFHNDPGALICHICNYTRSMPQKCPECGSLAIRQLGAGTQTVEKELTWLFPQARLLRWDAETARHKGAHEIILSHFLHHRADVLIGTQMVAKGLDLPLVTLVGVVLAEVGLNLPDFRASERTFQLLTQVAGRAGRSPLGGRVVLQTFQPDQPAIQFASRHDIVGFTESELQKRREIGYPPFSKLVRLEYRHNRSEKAQQEAQRMAVSIRSWLKDRELRVTEMIGPAPCFYARLAGQYRWQIILRGPDPRLALSGQSLGDWRVQVDPSSLL